MLLFLKTQKNKEKLLVELKMLEDKVKNNLSSLQVKHYDAIKQTTIDDPREYKQRLTHFRKIMSSLNTAKRFEYKFDHQGYLVSSIIDEVLEKALYETGIRKKLDTRKLIFRTGLATMVVITTVLCAKSAIEKEKDKMHRREARKYLIEQCDDIRLLQIIVTSAGERKIYDDFNRPIDYDDGVNLIIRKVESLGLNNVETAAYIQGYYGNYYILDSYILSSLKTTQEEVDEYLDNLYKDEVINAKENKKKVLE